MKLNYVQETKLNKKRHIQLNMSFNYNEPESLKQCFKFFPIGIN